MEQLLVELTQREELGGQEEQPLAPKAPGGRDDPTPNASSQDDPSPAGATSLRGETPSLEVGVL